MPRDPQGAGTRTEWRNVYAARGTLPEFKDGNFKSRKEADGEADYWAQKCPSDVRIAVEEVTMVTTITRYPIPPHAGEETKG